jgi:hypothetical protein
MKHIFKFSSKTPDAYSVADVVSTFLRWSHDLFLYQLVVYLGVL